LFVSFWTSESPKANRRFGRIRLLEIGTLGTPLFSQKVAASLNDLSLGIVEPL
jgi:hypothetical protein